MVFFGANGAPGPLQQLDTGGRHHQLGERVAPHGLQPFGAGFFHRVRRRAERQLGNKNGLAQPARQVQPLTKRLQPKDDRGLPGLNPGLVRPQKPGPRHLPLHQHNLQKPGRQGIHRRAHLHARGEQGQRAPRHQLQIRHQLLHHFLGESLGVLRVGLGFHHNQLALGAVVEGAGHFKRAHVRQMVQAGFLQVVVKAAATGERSRGDDGAAHLTPQILAQQVARHDRAGMRREHHQAGAAVGLEPLGQRLRAMLQHQRAGAHHLGQAWRQLAQAGVHQRVGQGLRRVFFGAQLQLGPQRLQGFGQATRMALNQGHGLQQLHRQHARAEAVHPLKTSAAAFEIVHEQTAQVHQGALELLCQGGDVLLQRHLNFFTDLVQSLGQFVKPAQVGQIHGAGKLVQRNGGQVVAFVKHHQAVVQVGQGFHAQGGQHQVVVGHNHMGFGEFGAGVVITAIAVARAVPRGAGMALGCHGRPVARVGLLGQAVAVAVPLLGR